MHRITLPLVLLAALTFFAGLGRGAITDSDEAFYAESAREMVASGDWLTPHYNYEPRFQKPVLYYWLTAVTDVILGTTEMAARWWAAVAGFGLVLVTAAAGRRWYDESTGLLAGAIVATNFGYFSIGRMALPDLPLTFCITLAIWAALVATLEQERSPRQWVLLASLALGLGFLMKGPVGLIIPALVIVPVLLIERRSIALTPSDIVLGFFVCVAVAVPWYAMMWLRHGNDEADECDGTEPREHPHPGDARSRPAGKHPGARERNCRLCTRAPASPPAPERQEQQQDEELGMGKAHPEDREAVEPKCGEVEFAESLQQVVHAAPALRRDLRRASSSSLTRASAFAFSSRARRSASALRRACSAASMLSTMARDSEVSSFARAPFTTRRANLIASASSSR